MRRITLWGLSTLTALVLLFSYHTSTGGAATVVAAAEAGVDGTTGPDTTGAGDPTADPGGTGTGTGGGAQTYLGEAVATRYGPVQVRITVVDGRITESAVTQVPWSDGKDRAINSRAVPVLNEEAVRSQSAAVDMVSGATYTSEGYAGSLQSAIDRAGL